MAEITTSERLMELIFTGIDHGIYSIQDGEGPLIPFVMTQNDDEIEMQRFVAETLEECVAKAKQFLLELAEKPERAIMAYDGMITIEGVKYDAIMVEGFEQNDSKGYCFAQRYKPKKFLSKFKEIGNVAYIDDIENILN